MPSATRIFFATVIVFFSSHFQHVFAEEAAKPIPGIGPSGTLTKVFTDFAFTEGPAADRAGNLYFTDIPNNRIHRVDAEGKLSTFIEPSNHANGLMVNKAGELVACEMDGQVVAWNLESKKRRVIAANYEGKRFNACNDLVIDAQGGIYFTDPHFRAPEPLPQKVVAVYYVDAKGKVTRLIDDLPAPNGVILSPDEKTLYVGPSGQAMMMAYEVVSPGKLGPPREFFRLQQPNPKENGGADGLAIDTEGNIYFTSALGVQVVSPAGKLMGIIPIPEKPANLAFGGPEGKTLYATARSSLYAVPMEARGHVFAK